jgi:hypothetical protein
MSPGPPGPARSGGSPPAASIIRMHAPTGPPVMPMRRYANRVTTSGGECRRSGTRQRRSSRSWAAASKLRVTSIPSGGLTPAHQHLSHLPDARPSRGALGAGVRLSGRSAAPCSQCWAGGIAVPLSRAVLWRPDASETFGIVGVDGVRPRPRCRRRSDRDRAPRPLRTTTGRAALVVLCPDCRALRPV